MSKAFIPLIIVAALSLSACSQKAQNELGQAGNTMTADANATMAEARSDVDAAADKAFGAEENKLDKVAADAKNKGGAALKDLGNEVQD